MRNIACHCQGIKLYPGLVRWFWLSNLKEFAYAVQRTQWNSMLLLFYSLVSDPNDFVWDSLYKLGPNAFYRTCQLSTQGESHKRSKFTSIFLEVTFLQAYLGQVL
jgi:hypothetical protein